jgi:sugar lactone lactonase YvrE
MMPEQTPELVAHVPGRPAGLGFMPDGRPLLATAMDKKLWWVEPGGTLTLAADLAGVAKGLLNDMVVDATGRAWVGDTGFDLLKGEPEVPGSLLSWKPGEEVRTEAVDVRFPNGIAISGDHRTLYLAETFGERVSAFTLSDVGRLTERRVHAQLAGKPDGMCLDADGALWVGLLWDQQFQRVDARGAVTDIIMLNEERAISCVLGGPQRRTLYLGVAHVDDSDKANVRRDGRLRSCTVKVSGAGIPV